MDLLLPKCPTSFYNQPSVLLMLCLTLPLLPQRALAMVSQEQAVTWIKNQVGIYYDVDDIYGYQCSDLGSAYINYLIYGDPFYWKNSGYNGFTTYAGYRYFYESYPENWERIPYTPGFVPNAGDILCFAAGTMNEYGHVAIAVEGCTASTLKMIEQSGVRQIPASEATRPYFSDYMNFQGVIRPYWGSGKSETPPLSSSTYYSVEFDVNDGGKNSNLGVCLMVEHNRPYGTYGSFPTPTRNGYTFGGWYTSASGGARVTEASIVTNARDHTLYAHWINNPTGLGDDFYARIYYSVGRGWNISRTGSDVQTAAQDDKDANQIWHFVRYGDTYAIQSIVDGKVWDAAQYGTDNGTNIQMLPDVGNQAQRWLISEDAGGRSGYYNIAPSYARYLAADATGYDKAASVYLWENNGTAAQAFQINVVSTGVTLSSNSLSIKVGEQHALYATTTPVAGSVTWSSSNTSVASVTQNGLVTAHSPGSATITVTASNGATSSCTVTVSSSVSTYTVSFNANGGTVSPSSMTTDTSFRLRKLPTPTELPPIC